LGPGSSWTHFGCRQRSAYVFPHVARSLIGHDLPIVDDPDALRAVARTAQRLEVAPAVVSSGEQRDDVVNAQAVATPASEAGVAVPPVDRRAVLGVDRGAVDADLLPVVD